MDNPKNSTMTYAGAGSKYGGQSREIWWTNRFPKKPVVYRAQHGHLRDVRNFIFPRSYILDEAIRRYNLRGTDDNSTVYKCLMFIIDAIKYVSDVDSRAQKEFWQYPEDTYARRCGDCEDGAILLKSLTLCAGVPDWKVKVAAGEVKGGGHAYCTYIRDDDTQIILDWCYWATRKSIEQRPDILNEPNYYEIWFSFNNQYSYAETKVLYAEGKSAPIRLKGDQNANN